MQAFGIESASNVKNNQGQHQRNSCQKDSRQSKDKSTHENSNSHRSSKEIPDKTDSDQFDESLLSASSIGYDIG